MTDKILIFSLIILSCIELIHAEPDDECSNKPVGMIIATSVVGTVGAITLSIGIASYFSEQVEPADEVGPNMGTGIYIICGSGWLCASAVLGVITVIKYRRWKDCKNQNAFHVDFGYDMLTNRYDGKIKFDIPVFKKY